MLSGSVTEVGPPSSSVSVVTARPIRIQNMLKLIGDCPNCAKQPSSRWLAAKAVAAMAVTVRPSTVSGTTAGRASRGQRTSAREPSGRGAKSAVRGRASVSDSSFRWLSRANSALMSGASPPQSSSSSSSCKRAASAAPGREEAFFVSGAGGVQRLPSVPALVTSNCSSSILHQSCQIDLVQQLLRLPVQQQIPAGCKVIGAEKLPQKCGGYGGYGQIVYRHAQLCSLTEGFL